MSRWLFPWSGSIKKRACRYLLQHYLGHFLQERLSLDQLGLDLYNGSGVIKEINLDVWAINELLESLGAPLEIVDGFVSSITVTIPWQALLTDHCTLEVTGLQITCRPKYRTSGGWDSQGWSSSMTSSMQLAQECLKDPPEASEEPPAQLEGLEMFAQTIETVLRRIKVTFIDTIVRIEHQPLDLETGVALEMHIKRLEYFDEAVRDPASQTAVPVDIHQPPAFLHKILQLSAVQLFYDSTGTVQGFPEENHPDSATASEGLEEEEEEEEEGEEEEEEEEEDEEEEEEEEDEKAPKPLAAPPYPPSQPLLIGSCSESETKCGGVQGRPLDSDDLRMIEEDLSKQLGSSPRDGDWDEEPDLEPYVTGLENGVLNEMNTDSDINMKMILPLLSLRQFADMFYSMGPTGMSSSMTSVRSGSELSDSDMESSTQSLASLTQPAALSAQGLMNCPRRYPVAGCLSSVPQASSRTRGRSHSGQAEQMKPDALLRLTLGGLTLTLLQEDPPASTDRASSLAQVSQVFFRELAFFKDSMFSERDFHHLRGGFAKACPHSHLRLTGAAVQVVCETRSGRRHSRAVTSDISFSRLELLECLWEDGRPQYSEVENLFVCLCALKLTLVFTLISVHVRGGDAQGPTAGLSGTNMGLIRDLGAAFFESHCELNDKTSSPFSSNRTMFETEEMVIPADPEEMRQFQAQCVAQCQCAVDINLPLAYILLPSKQAFQSIYNRINNDLLMWEPPPPPLPSARSPDHSRHRRDEFQLCKSAFRLDSDSEEDEPPFYLACESDGKTLQSAPRPNHNLSLLSLTVIIGKGRLQARTDRKRLEIPSFAPPKHLDPTIYPTEVGVSSVSGREGDLQMLSTAIKVTLDLQRNVKEFLVALRLQGATMRHYMAQSSQSWHEQLVDFLDVIDDPILGYTAPAVITVLHTHLTTCAVDYRPLYLPLRVLFTAESFSLSSNIIVDTATFHLRFILDDSALYLSDKCETDTVDLRRDYVCVLDIDLLELAITTWKGSDTGKLTQPLFELRCSNNVVHLHTCADSCAALVNMLQYLVSQGDLHPPPRHASPTEIAGQKLPLSECPASVLPCPPAETAEINQYDLADALIDTEKSHREESLDPGSPSMRRGSPVSVYLFPGEAPKRSPSVLQEEEEEEEDSELDGLVATATEAQADVMSEEGSDGSTDNDDFCILEAPGMGIPPRDGEPVVTVLSQGPIRVKDSHFSRPRGSSDLLRAPSRFPVPQSRVVLREISVVWHLYGGKDFGGKPMSIHAQQANRGRSVPAGVRMSPSRSVGASRPQNSWRWAGGSGRQHTLLMEIQLTKVSFQHESYPLAVAGPDGEGSVAAIVGVGPGSEQPLSRQVFIVQELEVRDRLASSQMNKFLYLHTSESMPRRAHSNMLTMKALQLCPESGLGGPECCLRVSLLPLRLNIDQDALFFLKDYFSNLASSVNPYLPVDPATEVKADPSQKVSDEAEVAAGLGPDLTASVETTYSEQSSSSAGSSSSSDQPIYFREFRFTSEVPIWLDYHGKHVVIEQATAETVYDILSPTPPLNRFTITEGRATSSRPRRAAQPADLREGVAKAYDTVREGVIDTAQTLCDVASRGHEQKGLPGAVGGVLRQIPPTVVRPLIVASEATSNLLGGMRNQIKPDARKEDFLKWRTEDGQE
ncbi:hypothetical protein F2P81_008049 [Scophthalmus maximus]|uniref:Autophagy related 2A n=1 Tax=Scophthalmus maximus TaxID=52904 RepID=A0A6A4T9G6_SCOMX|nr:hypothetical protein F2P81_008049 [Scophthalmus maximus]